MTIIASNDGAKCMSCGIVTIFAPLYCRPRSSTSTCKSIGVTMIKPCRGYMSHGKAPHWQVWGSGSLLSKVPQVARSLVKSHGPRNSTFHSSSHLVHEKVSEFLLRDVRMHCSASLYRGIAENLRGRDIIVLRSCLTSCASVGDK